MGRNERRQPLALPTGSAVAIEPQEQSRDVWAARLSMTVTVFFFSSRRRHTRCSRDWSSDVCSSDLHKGIHFGRGGRQPGQIESNASQQRGLVRFEGRFQPFGFQARKSEIVDWILWPVSVFDFWCCRSLQRIKRPVGLPLGALIDPVAD